MQQQHEESNRAHHESVQAQQALKANLEAKHCQDMLKFQQSIDWANQEAVDFVTQAGFPLSASANFFSPSNFTFHGVLVVIHQDHTFGSKTMSFNNFGNLNNGYMFDKTLGLDFDHAGLFTLKSLGLYHNVETAAAAVLFGLYNNVD